MGSSIDVITHHRGEAAVARLWLLEEGRPPGVTTFRSLDPLDSPWSLVQPWLVRLRPHWLSSESGSEERFQEHRGPPLGPYRGVTTQDAHPGEQQIGWVPVVGLNDGSRVCFLQKQNFGPKNDHIDSVLKRADRRLFRSTCGSELPEFWCSNDSTTLQQCEIHIDQ